MMGERFNVPLGYVALKSRLAPGRSTTIPAQGEDRGQRDLQRPSDRKGRFAARLRAAAVVLALSPLLAGCFITQTFQRGYVIPEGALDQIPLGASQEQVLIVLGTPSTVATISGEVFYYISQRTEQTSFLPQKEVDRRVIAVYFDKSRKVERLANYGMRDGKLFDYVSRTTPSGGEQQSIIGFFGKVFHL
jgi:outer membrane protein assembly factor BamE (lipoprotein component of BamABCDE complex)